MKYLTNSGLSYFLNKIKAYIASQLNSKASAIHTHTKSDIIDLPNGYVVDSTLDGTSSNAIANSTVKNALDGKSDVGHTHTKSDITDFPTLATVATSGSYNDLSNKPVTMTPTSHTHGNITNDGKIGSNANKPLITTTNGVITTGSFGTTANTFCQGNDSRLSDARAPTAHTHSASDITSGLATVATSGSYNDLSNKPTIPTVNNATLTIQKNGTTVKTFTANASSNVTANISVPTKVSQLTNDSGFITGVSWDNVSGKPSTFTPSSHTHTKSQITDFPSFGNTAGTICQGNDPRLSDARTPYFANGTWYAVGDDVAIGDHNVGGGLGVKSLNNATTRIDLCYKDDASNYKSITYDGTTLYMNGNCDYAASAGSVAWDNVTSKPTIPSNTSQLTNDSGYITSSGSCNYANSSGNADTLDGYHHDSFPKTYSALFTVNGLGTPGWSTIGTGTGGSCIQVQTTDNTYPSICFHRSGYSHCVLAESGGQLGTMQQGSEFNPLITSANIGSQNVNYANSAGSVAWDNVSGRPWALSQFTNDSGYITTDGAAYPRRVGGVTMNFNWSGQGGQPTWLWGGEDGTNMYVYNPANFSVNYANSAGYTNWLRTSSHADHLFHTEWDGSYFWTYVTAGDGGYRAVRVERSNSSGWADSAGGVAWGNVSGRPTALSQFTNDSGFITSENALPVGSYIQFAGSQAPAGFLVCNGGAISRTTYSKLFAVIGTTYGSGDGWSTFNLPNLIDRFLQGSTTSGTVRDAGLPNITGYIYSAAHSGLEQQGVFWANDLDSQLYGSDVNYFWRWGFNASRSSSIYGNSSTVQPPALTCLICIKY